MGLILGHMSSVVLTSVQREVRSRKSSFHPEGCHEGAARGTALGMEGRFSRPHSGWRLVPDCTLQDYKTEFHTRVKCLSGIRSQFEVQLVELCLNILLIFNIFYFSILILKRCKKSPRLNVSMFLLSMLPHAIPTFTHNVTK